MPTYEQWLKSFEMVINAPNPRRAKTPLMMCEMGWPGSGLGAAPTVEVFEKILGALVKLRHSRCYGRVDAEAGMIRKIWWVVSDLVNFDRPPDQSGELFPLEAAPVPEADRKRNLAIMRLAAEYAAEALVDRPPRETQTHRRVNEALELLGELTCREELRGLIERVVVKARKMIAGVEDDTTSAAIEFLQSYYCRHDVEISEEFLNELRDLEARIQRETVLFQINSLLIAVGEIDELTAMSSVDLFRDCREDLMGDSDL